MLTGDQSDRFAPGDLFAGRYRMVTLLGRGDHGDVWRADDLVLQTPVALKFLNVDGVEARERILAQVRLSRRMTHAAVCRVFDFGEAGNDVFVSMELIEGEDLSELLKRVGRLPSEKVIDIAEQLCDGLAAAHAQGVLHRNLTLTNIVIEWDPLESTCRHASLSIL